MLCLRISLGLDAADLEYILTPDIVFYIYKLNFKKDT